MSKCFCYDCFAYIGEGKCSALWEHSIPKAACPFYKTHKRQREEKAFVYFRLTSLGRDDLILKYYNKKG